MIVRECMPGRLDSIVWRCARRTAPSRPVGRSPGKTPGPVENRGATVSQCGKAPGGRPASGSDLLH